MNKIFQNEVYSKIINFDDTEVIKNNINNNKVPNNIRKKDSLRTKILNKYFLKKLNCVKCFIIIVIIFFSFSLFIEKLDKIQMKSKDNINIIFLNVLELYKSQRNIKIIKDNNSKNNNDLINKEKDNPINSNKNNKSITAKTNKRKEESINKNNNNTNINNITNNINNNITKNINNYITNNFTNNITKNITNKITNNITNNISNNISNNIINKINEKNKKKEKEKEKKEIKPKKEDIYKIEKFEPLRMSFNKAKIFLDKSIKGKYIQKRPFKLSKNPRASAVIPVYNSQNVISRAIKSIQNQNLLDLEIVLVNDCSTDKTLSVLEKLQKEDPRIKVLKNKKNMGTLYSRSIGALSARGKYIFPLDNDDMFLDKDVFSTITNIGNKGNFDIVEFKGIKLLMGRATNLLNRRIEDSSYSNHKLNLVMFQPELGNYPIRPGNKMGNYNLYSVFLWGKCIKTEIYQKTLKKFGEERYSRYMILHEDIVAICGLFNTARSYKFVGKYGVVHIHRADSAGKRKRVDLERNVYNMYLTDIAIDFVQNTKENKKLLVYLIMYMLNRPKLDETLKNEYHKKLFFSCLDRILNSSFISDTYKNEIRKKGKTKKFIKYPF